MKEEEIALSPVAGWEIGAIPAYGALMLRLDYLTHATQQPDEAQKSPTFLIHTAQARELAQRILAACEKLESGPPPGTGLPKH